MLASCLPWSKLTPDLQQAQKSIKMAPSRIVPSSANEEVCDYFAERLKHFQKTTSIQKKALKPLKTVWDIWNEDATSRGFLTNLLVQSRNEMPSIAVLNRIAKAAGRFPKEKNRIVRVMKGFLEREKTSHKRLWPADIDGALRWARRPAVRRVVPNRALEEEDLRVFDDVSDTSEDGTEASTSDVVGENPESAERLGGGGGGDDDDVDDEDTMTNISEVIHVASNNNNVDIAADPAPSEFEETASQLTDARVDASIDIIITNLQGQPLHQFHPAGDADLVPQFFREVNRIRQPEQREVVRIKVTAFHADIRAASLDLWITDYRAEERFREFLDRCAFYALEKPGRGRVLPVHIKGKPVNWVL